MTEPCALTPDELTALRKRATRGRMLTLQERLAVRLAARVPGRRLPPRPDADPLPGPRGPVTEGAQP